MRFLIIFFIFVYIKICLSSCDVGESPAECSAYCFRVVKPCLSYLDVLQNRVNAYESSVPSDILARVSLTDTKMDILGRQMATLQEKEEDYQRKIIKLEDRLTKGVPSHFGEFQKLGLKYYYVEKELRETWHGAVKKCHEMGGFLASLQGQHEIDAVSGKLKEYSGYWIDVTDQFKEGLYVSISTGLRATFLNWDVNEPTQKGEQCVELHTYKEPPVMNDNACSNKKYFICESSAEVDDTK